jgi:hypothetical protein
MQKPLILEILKFKIKYDGENNNCLPNQDTYKFLDLIEEEINSELKGF